MKVRIAALVCALLLTAAAAASILFAWSDLLRNSGDLPALQQAIRLAPLDTRPLLRKAAVLTATDPAGTADEALLQRIVALNPLDAEAWMAIGLKAEMRGNPALAESNLLHAAELDHTFKPAWTLANFYVRTGEETKFWHWIRICIDLVEPRNAEILTFDPRPMFALCWNVSDSAAVILERAIPRKHFILRSYLGYLEATERFDAAMPVARELAPLADKVDHDVLMGLCNTMLTRKNVAEAVELWNAMSARGVIALAALNPAKGIFLTNGELRGAPMNQGFDWRFGRPGGIYDTYSAAVPFLRLDFDGDEPEHCVVLAQLVPLVPGSRYRLEYSYETADLTGAATGLQWAMGADTGSVAPRDPQTDPALPSHFEFTAPRTPDVPALLLRYDRLPGTVKIKGSFKLLRADLRMAP